MDDSIVCKHCEKAWISKVYIKLLDKTVYRFLCGSSFEVHQKSYDTSWKINCAPLPQKPVHYFPYQDLD